jgi:eukaryotic-like serine/threonine-protein kinase
MADKKMIGNKYELVAPLGEGGMASVYRGLTHGAAGFSCKVAIKRVLPNLAEDAAFVAMFVEEARVASELSHPNIVQVHDFDRDAEGRYFIVMEWIDGIDLFSWIESFRGAPTPWHEVAAIGVEILRGLGAAHERVDGAGNPAPVIHRDVSPQNVLLSVQGMVKLADFGLARAADRNTMTAPGTIKGKLGYMAPELIKRAPASPRSDLYSVGIVLWEALTGKRLYGGDAMDQVKKILANQVPQLRDVRSDVPLPLAEVVHGALSFDPADRFERAEEMQRALASLTKNHTEPTDDRALARSIRDAIARRSRSKM